MSAISGNIAAWLPTEKATTMELGPGPTPEPAENEVVIQVSYAAVNPADYKIQDYAPFPMPYPFILGTDVSGTIVQLGSKVNRFKIGQRVIAHCDSLLTHKASHSGYQRFTTCLEILVSAIPDSLPLANAAVLPLSISTASAGLFKILKLPFPSVNPKPTGKSILIWGGSSSCGCSAIQLAVAAGLTVVTTAGTQNHDLMKSLGATYVFDYQESNIINNILQVLQIGDVVYDCIGDSSTQKACANILSKLGGGKLPCVLTPIVTEYNNVEIEFVNGLDPGLVDLNIGDAVWRNYIPEALAVGKFQAKPEREILEGGLERVQDGIDILRKGVSAKKIVIEVIKEASV